MAKKEIKQEEPTRKVQLSFTLSKGVNDRYLSHCKEKMLNKSQILESLIIEYMNKQDFAGMTRIE